MKVFELCTCVLACITFTSSMTIISKLVEPSNNKEQFTNSCIIEAGMTYEDDYDIRDIINDNVDKPQLEEKTRKYGCVIECLLRKINWMEESELKEEKIYADINEAFANHTLQIQVQELVRDCATKVKDVPQERCERGVVAMKCGVNIAYRLFPFVILDEDEDDEENGKIEYN